ncbi:hypothetical protein IT575_15320 [bacterium]|nr:hypothetical protein [bacterium]
MKETSNPALQGIEGWGLSWINPIVAAMRSHEPRTCEDCMRRARQELQSSKLDRDATQALELQIDYLEFKAALQFCSEHYSRRLFERLRARLQQASGGRATTLIRNSRLLQLLEIGEQQGWCRLEPAQLTELIGQLGLHYRSCELGYHLASWAFRNMRVDLLEVVMEDMYLLPAGDDLFSSWRRAVLLRNLLLDEAREQEVLGYLSSVRQHSSLQDFRINIWPWLEQRGRISPALSLLLEQRCSALRAGQDFFHAQQSPAVCSVV